MKPKSANPGRSIWDAGGIAAPEPYFSFTWRRLIREAIKFAYNLLGQ
jgi:hypothetical protein